MKSLKTVLYVGLLLALTAPGAFADVNLWEWALNINGDVYASSDPAYPSIPPANVTTTLPWSWATQQFDVLGNPIINSSMGTISIPFTLPGVYFVSAYFDYDIYNVYSNETGTAVGAAPGYLTWEIGDPLASIYYDVTGGAPLPNLDTPYTGDVALAQRIAFIVGAGEQATVRLMLGNTAPASGFYLQQHDPGEVGSPAYDLYFQTKVDFSPTGVVPEPASLFLFGTVLAGVATRFLRRSS